MDITRVFGVTFLFGFFPFIFGLWVIVLHVQKKPVLHIWGFIFTKILPFVDEGWFIGGEGDFLSVHKQLSTSF